MDASRGKPGCHKQLKRSEFNGEEAKNSVIEIKEIVRGKGKG